MLTRWEEELLSSEPGVFSSWHLALSGAGRSLSWRRESPPFADSKVKIKEAGKRKLR